MTEAEWLAGANPGHMLRFVEATASHRKLRLCACALCCSLLEWISDVDTRQALAIAERYADAEVSDQQLGLAWDLARRRELVLKRSGGESAESDAVRALKECCDTDIARVKAIAVCLPSLRGLCEAISPTSTTNRVDGKQLLRCIFGNPFRPVAVDPAWLTSTVIALARGMYKSRDFGAMPILADALQDAGCDNDDVLNHCRGPRPHTPGCWVVDLVLGKS